MTNPDCCKNATDYVEWKEDDDLEQRTMGWFLVHTGIQVRYCPFCGAMLPMIPRQPGATKPPALTMVHLQAKSFRAEGDPGQTIDRTMNSQFGHLTMRIDQARDVRPDAEGRFLVHSETVAVRARIQYDKPMTTEELRSANR